MTSTISPEVQTLITRARERMAEQDAHDVKQREANFTIDGRHAEFCGAYRELLDMLAEQLEREAGICPSCGSRGDHRDWCGNEPGLRIVPCPICSVPMRVRAGHPDCVA